MKIQVIPIEAHDDVVSLRDKLAWVKARRVVLICPRRAAPIDTRLAWLLVRRKAEAMGASLALVTHSAEVRRLAQEAGIPVFATLLEAQRGDWTVAPRRRLRDSSPRPQREALRPARRRSEPHRLASPAARLLLFSLAVLALLALLFFILPAAEIHLSPVLIGQWLSLRIQATADPVQAGAYGYLSLLPASVTVEGETFRSASGQISLPLTAARGSVRFRNLTDAVVGIPAGTVVQTVNSPPVRFFTLSDAVVDAGVDHWVDVAVQAELAGAAGNLPPDSLVAIPGSLQASLAVTNPQATWGGRDRLAPAPTSDDRQKARQALLAELRRRALDSLQEQVGVSDVLLPDTLTVVETLEENLPPEGQAGDVLMVRLRVTFMAYYLPGAEVLRLAEAALDSSLPAGFVPVEGSLSVRPADRCEVGEAGVATCRLLLHRSLKREVELLALARRVRGRRPAVAASVLATSLALQDAPRVRIKPVWWPWLPFTEFRIAIEDTINDENSGR